MDMRRLAAIPLFSTLPEADLVAAVANELEIGEGDTLTTEDEFGHCLFAIGAGTAEVIRDGATLRRFYVVKGSSDISRRRR